jgi:tight adherence protein B
MSMDDVLYLFLIFVLLFSTALALWFGFSSTFARDRVMRRLTRVRDRFIGKAEPDAVAALILKREEKKSRLDALIARFLPNPEHWRKLLVRTGTSLTIGQVAVASVVFGLAVGIALQLIGISPFMGWPSAVVCAYYAPRVVIGGLVARRATKFIAIFPDAVGLMVRGLRAGLPLTETVIGIAREIGDPVGSEFRHIADQIQLGKPLEEALWESAERLDLPEFTFMAIAFSIQRETGGNLAETLENLDQILRRRRQLHLKIRTFSAEARASATIIGSLPFFAIAILSALDWEYISILFKTPSGHLYLSAAMGCLVVGIGTMIRMGRFRI